MKRAGLETGSRRSNGFTLIEVLLSVTIFIVGISFIYLAFYKSADVISRLSRQYEAASVITDLIEETELSLRETKKPDSIPLMGEKKIQNHLYQYTLSLMPLDKKKRAYRMSVHLEWAEGRKGSISRSACVLS